MLERWREHDVFAESLRRRAGSPEWVFHEGPPTANGAPGSHHVLARVFKDVFPRYKTMTGHYVERKGGWDCHGLPVELAVEAELGFESKDDIERYGIAEFNARCRESVLAYVEDWRRLTERIGFWIDLDDAYRTFDDDYVESVWWALRSIWDSGLLYEGYKVVPHCPRDQTTLSSHELAQPGAYRDVVDPSVYVRLPVVSVPERSGPVRVGDELLVWTTTPWTLVSNAAVAIDPELTYVRARAAADAGDSAGAQDPAGAGPTFVLARDLVERVLGEGAELLDAFLGAAMIGIAYDPPFQFIAAEEYGPNGHTVLPGDFVTAAEGTGLVHAAVAFGEDDFRLGEQHGLRVINPVRPDGTYDERIGPYAGRHVKDADADLVADLRARGRLLRAERCEHSYPHCWRCGTALLYYAKSSWYIRTSAIRDRLLAANEAVNWHPEHVKHGRFGRWLESNVDWALSRERYWGTPLPIWRCAAGHTICIGSFAELEALTGQPVGDPHRPYVDELRFACPECPEQMTRVPEVIDVWFDSGSMPFAQFHFPFDNGELFQRRFPADFVCEALDQTRGWFYSLLAVATLLFDRSSFRNVVCLGLILDPEGQKMSKSRGNVVEPWDVLDSYGADAFRWYYLTSKQPWDNYRFSLETIGESVRQFLLPLWNCYRTYVVYANAEGLAPAALTDAPITADLDRWIRSRLAATTAIVRERLEGYDATFAGRAIAELVDDLSSWYIRRSRRRFWDGEPAALATLHHCLLTIARLLAPFTPFVADEVYDNLAVDGELSVHLCDFPLAEDVGERDERLERSMEVAREAVRLGLSARGQAGLKVRQPLREAVVVAAGEERAALERLQGLVAEELNVKRLRFVSAADELGRYEVKPNYRVLGPRFGRQMPQVAAAVAGVDPEHVATALAAGRPIAISIDGHDHELDSADLSLVMRPLDGYQLEREGSHAVALDLNLDDELIREGLAREAVHAIQAARKDAGLAVEDRVELTVAGDAELLDAIRVHESYVAGETLAVTVSYGNGAAADAPRATVAGRELLIAVRRA